MSDDRLSLLLTDILGDLKIVDESGALWSPESIRQALDKSYAGGLELASLLVNRLTTSTDIKLESWDGLLKQHATLCPPWVSEKDLSKKPLRFKFEVLCFLASTLQNRLLRQTKASNPKGEAAATAITAATRTQSSSASDAPISLPSHLSQEQRALILDCFQGLKADYDKRRVGMKQRLDILVSNFEDDFEADNPDDNKDMAELKQQLQGLSLNQASLPIELKEEELLAHFRTPHSKGLGSRTPVPKSGGANPLEANFTVQDRGGRTDEIESRISTPAMPEWKS